MHDQVEEVVGKNFCNFGRYFVILPAAAREDTDPALNRRPHQKLAVGILRHEFKRISNQVRIFGSDVD
jgi:hypothetical protein